MALQLLPPLPLFAAAFLLTTVAFFAGVPHILTSIELRIGSCVCGLRAAPLSLAVPCTTPALGSTAYVLIPAAANELVRVPHIEYVVMAIRVRAW